MATPSAPTATKDRITCHILDTSVGRPARGVRVKLELLSVDPADQPDPATAANHIPPTSSDPSEQPPSSPATTTPSATTLPTTTAAATAAAAAAATNSSSASATSPAPPPPPQQPQQPQQPPHLSLPSPGGQHHLQFFPHQQQPRVFEAFTDDDGRVQAWLPYSSATSSGEVPVYTLEDVLAADVGPRRASRWVLRFDSAGYFGGEDRTFFPEVAVHFRVDGGDQEQQHYHVPLLLAPWAYSTYRGS